MKHIIIADDDPVVRHILSSILKSLGYEVSAAASGEELLRLFDRLLEDGSSPSLLFLDMHLGDMTGEEALTLMRSNSRFSSLPVVILSANSKQEILKESPALSGETFLEKPFTPDVAGALLEEVFSEA